jgi:UDPglucose 6-dehydrogenase
LFVCSSTTTPGSVREEIIPLLEKETGGVCGKDFGFCYNPEFIALGDVIRGLLGPDLVLIGESDKASGDRLAELYAHYNTNQPRVARMSITSAELTKISINSYVTAKISFTNQLRLIADGYADTDIHAMLDAIGSDSRIGRKYFKSGLSFGGPCFPRDNRLVAYAAKKVGITAPLALATDEVNNLTNAAFATQVKSLVRSGDTVAILGMAYRPDTAIVEEAAGLHLAQALVQHGCRVVVHDYCATPANCPPLKEFNWLADPAQLAAEQNLKAIVIACPSAGYRKVSFPPGVRLLDPWGLLT